VYYANNAYYYKSYYYFGNPYILYKFPYLTADPSPYGYYSKCIAAHTIPMGDHVGYLLPLDTKTYTVILKAQLAINQDCLSLLYNPTTTIGFKPYAEIYYEQSYNYTVLAETSNTSAGRIEFTQADLILDPNTQMPLLYGGDYYLTQISNLSVPLEVSTDPNSLYGRRTLSVRTDPRFSIVLAEIEITPK
jgi:hypothetical protein